MKALCRNAWGLLFSFQMIKPPCKNCQDRTIGCHATCENYISYKKKLEERNKRISEYNDVQGFDIHMMNTFTKRRRA